MPAAREGWLKQREPEKKNVIEGDKRIPGRFLVSFKVYVRRGGILLPGCNQGVVEGGCYPELAFDPDVLRAGRLAGQFIQYGGSQRLIVAYIAAEGIVGRAYVRLYAGKR